MKLKYAVICASNQNRSMEAHLVLSRKGINISSYGTNAVVKLPGPSADRPNSYPFGTPYETIYQDLKAKDEKLYRQNGLLLMLERNRKIKQAPQRFQDATQDYHDIIITCEERCFDIVTQDLNNRTVTAGASGIGKAVHVVNFDIRDTPEDATVGALSILALVQRIEVGVNDDLDTEIEEILEDFQKKTSQSILHTVCFY